MQRRFHDRTPSRWLHRAEPSYFAEIAFAPEFGASANPLLHRWEAGPSIRVHGTPSVTDEVTLTEVIAEINTLTGIGLQRTDGTGSIDLYFVPQADFPVYEPNYVPGNSGFVWVWSDQPQRIVRARIMAASDISQEGRSHVIREELTQRASGCWGTRSGIRRASSMRQRNSSRATPPSTAPSSRCSTGPS